MTPSLPFKSLVVFSLILICASHLRAQPISNQTSHPNIVAPSSEPPYATVEPEPEVESTPEAEATPESEWGAEPSVETEAETTAEIGVEETPFTEPEPDWPVAKQEWGVAWEIHIYVFGALFGILAIYSVVSVVRLFRRKQLLSRKYFITLNVLIFLIATLRCIYLFVDAYNSSRTFPTFISYLLYNIPMPCLTSAFSLLFFALLQTLQMTFISAKIQKLKYLLSIIIFHFALSIISDIIVGLLSTAEVLLHVCQGVFIIWGLFLFVGFLFIFRNLYSYAKRRQFEEDKLSHSYKSQMQNHVNNRKYKQQSHRYTMSLAVIATLITSIFGLVIVGLELYATFGLYSQEMIKPWEFWAFMTAFRFVEFCMCALISYIGTQPFQYNAEKHSCHICITCCQSCRNGSDIVDGGDNSYLASNNGESALIKSNHVNEDSVPLFTVTAGENSIHGSMFNGDLGSRDPRDSDSIKFIDDDSTRSLASFGSLCIVPDNNELEPFGANITNENEVGSANKSAKEQNPKQKRENECVQKPLVYVSQFENHLAEQVKPRGRLNRTPALDDNSSWDPDISKSGEIPHHHISTGDIARPADGTLMSEAEDIPRVKYRLKQRHPLMQRSSSEGGPFPAAGHLGYVSSSDSENDVPPVDREELAKSADLSEFNKDVQHAMASLIDDSSQEFIEMEVDV